MDLYSLIPDNSGNWIVTDKYLMYRKYSNVPVCYIQDDVVYIFLDGKVRNVIFKLVKHLTKMGVEFYFTTPRLSNPKKVENVNEEIIKHYLFTYSQKEFFFGFKKIGLNLIDNMVKWTDKEKCFDLVKPLFDNTLKSVMRQTQNLTSGRYEYDFVDEIRDEFQSLYRDIQISKLLN